MTAGPELDIRREEPSDREAVDAVVRAAFDSDAEARLVDTLRVDASHIAELSVVADLGGRVVGHVMLTRCWIGESPALALAPVSVLPEHQDGGVGTAMIASALGSARALGETAVVVLGHPGYYPRFGFTPAVESGVRLSVPVPEETLKVLALDPSQPVPAGQVTYAEPFGI